MIVQANPGFYLLYAGEYVDRTPAFGERVPIVAWQIKEGEPPIPITLFSALVTEKMLEDAAIKSPDSELLYGEDATVWADEVEWRSYVTRSYARRSKAA